MEKDDAPVLEAEYGSMGPMRCRPSDDDTPVCQCGRNKAIVHLVGKKCVRRMCIDCAWSKSRGVGDAT